MVKSYIHIYLDVENPDGDEVAFESENIDSILHYLQSHAKAVVPE